MNKIKLSGAISLIVGIITLITGILLYFNELNGAAWIIVISIVINIVGINLLTYKKK